MGYGIRDGINYGALADSNRRYAHEQVIKEIKDMKKEIEELKEILLELKEQINEMGSDHSSD